MRQYQFSFLNAWDNTQVARAISSVFVWNTRWRHGRSRGETKYRHIMIRSNVLMCAEISCFHNKRMERLMMITTTHLLSIFVLMQNIFARIKSISLILCIHLKLLHIEWYPHQEWRHVRNYELFLYFVKFVWKNPFCFPAYVCISLIRHIISLIIDAHCLWIEAWDMVFYYVNSPTCAKYWNLWQCISL